jgi:hypothetical protein
VNELQPSEVLCVPKRRRFVHSKEKAPDGQDILHVFYGDKEIVFDEPELVPFGDRLLSVERFRAEEAMSWADGTPHAWEKVRELLEALLEHEILKRVSEAAPAPSAQQPFPTKLEPDRPTREPRTFSAHQDQCPFITQEAYGRAIELSNLEVILPVYRVAHPALDRDGRQVGENNVAPRPLFLDLPTQRRLCNYAGSRYQADVPMNVTALKHMTSRWPELLSLTEQFRRAFLERLPLEGATLSVGELQLLGVCCLASVGYVMVRGVQPVPNGQLDAGLAAMFRLVDGVRLVTTELIRAEASSHGCDQPVSARSIADYAERNSMYEGVYGVCAGPQALIDEYLRVLVGEGDAPIQAEPSLSSRLGDLGAALDYGLLGQRVESLVRAFGAAQGLLHERLREAFRYAGPPSKLQELVQAPIDADHYPLLRAGHPLLDTLQLELSVSRWMFARAGAGLPVVATHGVQSIDDVLRLDPAAQMADQRRLLELLAQILPDHPSFTEELRVELARVVVDVLALERRCLRAVEREQRYLNERLERPPGPALTGADFAVYNRPRTGPPLELTLEQGLNLAISTTAAATTLRCGQRVLCLHA